MLIVFAGARVGSKNPVFWFMGAQARISTPGEKNFCLVVIHRRAVDPMQSMWGFKRGIQGGSGKIFPLRWLRFRARIHHLALENIAPLGRASTGSILGAKGSAAGLARGHDQGKTPHQSLGQ